MKKYHFIGIGGIGMSGIAKVLLQKGNQVSGSDLKLNKQTDELKKLGATIYQGHSANNLSNDTDFVVVTSAVKAENLEVIKARNLEIPILTRSELLNEVITAGKKSIAVTGTHGKTTTSSMIAAILEKAGLNPTAVIGSDLKEIGGNAKFGKGDFAVAEVCEYQRAFLDIFPYSAVITNIEADHLDCYKDINDIIDAFSDFSTHIDKNGLLIAYGEDKNVDEAIKNYNGKLIKYGQNPSNDWYFKNLETVGHNTVFEVIGEGVNYGQFELSIPGIHNVLNALAAIVLTTSLGVEVDSIKKALAEFKGAERRFEIKGERNGVLFIDDYGHHPTEIEATLKGAREFYKNKNIIAVFQPHQHSRTKFLLEDFSKSFSNADEVIIPEIYAVRDTEADIQSVSSRDLVEKINQLSPQKAQYFKDFEETAKYLKEYAKEGDVVITIGAGPVVEVAEKILK